MHHQHHGTARKLAKRFLHGFTNSKAYRPRPAFLAILLLVIGFSVFVWNGTLEREPSHLARVDSVEVGFSELSPMGRAGGSIVPASCPSYPHSGTGVPESGACSVSNACGTAAGTYDDFCTCSATPPGAPNYGQSCSSAPNCAGVTSPGTIQCDGSCSATPPPCPPSNGTISASPNPCTLSGGVCTSNISWQANNAPGARVYVRESGALFGSGAGPASQAAPWITASGYHFDLHQTDISSPVLASIYVYGVAPASPPPPPPPVGGCTPIWNGCTYWIPGGSPQCIVGSCPAGTVEELGVMGASGSQYCGLPYNTCIPGASPPPPPPVPPVPNVMLCENSCKSGLSGTHLAGSAFTMYDTDPAKNMHLCIGYRNYCDPVSGLIDCTTAATNPGICVDDPSWWITTNEPGNWGLASDGTMSNYSCTGGSCTFAVKWFNGGSQSFLGWQSSPFTDTIPEVLTPNTIVDGTPKTAFIGVHVHDPFYPPRYLDLSNSGVRVDVYPNAAPPPPPPPGNVPPIVNAGSDQMIIQPASSVILNGSAVDPDGSIANVKWTKVAGPATFVISSSNSLSTSVTGLSTLGTYTFRLTATDNLGATAFDDVNINVVAGAQPDLIPQGGITPTTVFANNSTTFSGTVHNQGAGGTIVGFNNFLQISVDPAGGGPYTDLPSVAMPALAANASLPTSQSYTFPTAGTYAMRACADKANSGDLGTISESNEGNNCGAWTDITVGTPQAKIHVAPKPYTYPDTNIQESSSQTFLIRNIGDSGSTLNGTLSISGDPEFTLDCMGPCSYSLPYNATKLFTVVFAPVLSTPVDVPRSAVISLTGSGGSPNDSVQVWGVAKLPFTIDPTPVNFNDLVVVLDHTKTKTMTITYTGAKPSFDAGTFSMPTTTPAGLPNHFTSIPPLEVRAPFICVGATGGHYNAARYPDTCDANGMAPGNTVTYTIQFQPDATSTAGGFDGFGCLSGLCAQSAPQIRFIGTGLPPNFNVKEQ